ncbi:hypothetical protein [Streptomyces sp. NPDC004267]|uniref:hypothetical protein n=1 Tax=Streptomyces sp. NPDC004267 TaxID=3364694 RepID=UPI0036A4D675
MWIRKQRQAPPAAPPSAQDERHQKARDFVAGLNLPPATSVRELIPFVESHTGRRIKLMPVTDRAGLMPTGDRSSPCGTWLAIKSTDYIFYDASTSIVHQDLIIGHEFAHILRRHQSLADVDEGDEEDEGADLATKLAALGDLGGLLPDLTPNMILMLLARTRYTEPEEADAETIGSLLSEHVHSSSANRRRDDPISRTLLRRPR